MKKVFVLVFMLSVFNGCTVVEMMTGANFDPDRFALYRQAKIKELQLKSANTLNERLAKKESVLDADMVVTLDDKILNKLLDQYENATGLLDSDTDYMIKDVKLSLQNGVAIASIGLLAHNEPHNINVDLMMDCLIMIEPMDIDLALKLEPFNITPVIETKGVYTAAKDIINKLIKLNLGEISKKLPLIKIPVNIENAIEIPGTKTSIKSQINLEIVNPKHNIQYKLGIKEILFFKDKVVVSLNLNKVKVS